MPTDVLVPPLGQTVDTVRLVSWYKQDGDPVQQGEPLFVIETDKAMLDVEAPATGTLRQVAAQAGDEVRALNAIAVIVESAAAPEPDHTEDARGASPHPPAQPEVSPSLRLSEAEPQISPSPPVSPPRQRAFISPRARRLAAEHGVPIGAVSPTGPEGAIIERDVRAYLEQQAQALAPGISPVARRVAEEAGLDWHALAGSGPRGQVTREDVEAALRSPSTTEEGETESAEEPYEILPLAGMRALIAERMVASHANTAPVTLTTEADATALVTLRGQLRDDGIAASYNDLLIYILARALAEHPRLNATLDGESIKLWERVHIGLAVDTDRGLLVPVLRDAGKKGLALIARETAPLVERARAGRCAPEELRGGTFTLTNLGHLGIDAFTPIINLPECAILGVGRIRGRPTIRGKKVRERQAVWLSLTFDHRLVDGAPAARFLQRVVQLVERPHLLLA